jgi:hypothetical protein
MRTIAGVIALTVLSSLFASGQDKPQRSSPQQPLADAKHESPFACDRLALGPKRTEAPLRRTRTNTTEIENQHEGVGRWLRV